jgi:tetratricopeptide (TPR) repeat protein
LAYSRAGRADDAIKISEGTLKAMDVKFGPKHPDTLTTRHNLALVYKALARKDRDAGQQRLGIEPYRRAIVIAEDLTQRDPGSPVYKELLAWFLVDFGMCLREVGLTDEAEARLRQSLELWLGRISQTASARRNQVDNLRWTLGELREASHVSRRFAAAAEDHRRAIAAAERLGEAQPDVPDFAVLLAEFHEGLGALLDESGPQDAAHSIRVKAASMRERATVLCESKLGQTHADTLACRDRLAEDFEALGRWADAERLRRETLSRREAGAPRGPSSAGDLIAVGRDLLMQARHHEAEAWLREGLALFGPGSAGDWEPYQAKSLLGGSLLGQGNYADAEKPLVEGYEGMRARAWRMPAPERSRLREAAERVIRLYEACGKLDQAAAWKAKLSMPDLPANVFAGP